MTRFQLNFGERKEMRKSCCSSGVRDEAILTTLLIQNTVEDWSSKKLHN